MSKKIKDKPTEKKLKNTHHSHGLEDFLKYLPDLNGNNKSLTLFGKFKSYVKKVAHRINKKGLKRISIMLIPHTEKKIISWHLNLYSIFIIVIFLCVIMILSILGLVNKSGEDIQFYDMGLGNKEFSIQAINIAEEVLPLHELINSYTITIAELFLKINGDKNQIQSLSSQSHKDLNLEIEKIRKMVSLCKKQNDACNRESIEDILRNAIYLSYQDNHNIKKAIDISDSILENLKTKEKRNLFKNTPTIWPVNGYLISPYGPQIDPIRGRKVFKRGIEIGAMLGTEVVATAPGEILDISYDEEYGLKIFINHSYGFATFYAHLDRVQVKKGEKISKGDVIGFVGQTGRVNQPMLYYEVHVGTVAYNPFAFINHLQNPWLAQPKT